MTIKAIAISLLANYSFACRALQRVTLFLSRQSEFLVMSHFNVVDLERLLGLLDERTRGPNVVDLAHAKKKRAAEREAWQLPQRRPQAGHSGAVFARPGPNRQQC